MSFAEIAELKVHEDMEGLRCLHPLASLPHLKLEINAATDHAVKSQDPSGFPSSMHIVEPRQVDNLPISRVDFAAAVSLHLPRIRTFILGIPGVFGYRIDDACCFGFGEECFIIAVEQDDGTHAVFFEATTESLDQLLMLRRAIEALGGVLKIALIDYWEYVAGDVNDSRFLDDYFGALNRMA
jgi:hypothetical protein